MFDVAAILSCHYNDAQEDHSEAGKVPITIRPEKCAYKATYPLIVGARVTPIRLYKKISPRFPFKISKIFLIKILNYGKRVREEL